MDMPYRMDLSPQEKTRVLARMNTPKGIAHHQGVKDRFFKPEVRKSIRKSNPARVLVGLDLAEYHLNQGNAAEARRLIQAEMAKLQMLKVVA